MAAPRDYYEVLGVGEGAGTEDDDVIDAEYRPGR